MSYVWGVDVSTRYIALAFAVDTRIAWNTFSLPRLTELSHGARLELFYEQTLIRAKELVSRWPPSCVCVEQPMGKAHVPILDNTCGVVCAALARATHAPVWQLRIGQWKKLSVGKGNASKQEVLEWAYSYGYTGALQDEADAIGIAVAAQSLVEHGEAIEA